MTTALPSTSDVIIARARSALLLAFTADALSMPVHWFYNPSDIPRFFPPNGIQRMEAAPARHPSSIMNLHSTAAGGRGRQGASGSAPEIVGDVILKGKRQFWGVKEMHYHNGMAAGENTLNAHCARLMMRTLSASQGTYDATTFFKAYVDFMTADPPKHPDTYAESYHRGFFANLTQGTPLLQCGAATHDTPSVGGLVTAIPLTISELLRHRDVDRAQRVVAAHVAVTHPDATLEKAVRDYVRLVHALLFRDVSSSGGTDVAHPEAVIKAIGGPWLGKPLAQLPSLADVVDDSTVVGGSFSPACYITDSFPSLLFLAGKYAGRAKAGLLANTNLGGENCHRGAVLGSLLGLVEPTPSAAEEELSSQLADGQAIRSEIDALLRAALTSTA